MKVILYNPVSSASRKPILPLSLLALGAVLEGRHEYVIIDGNLTADPLAEISARLAAGDRPAVLAVTVMPGPQLADAVRLCKALRPRYPELFIVWGGYFPTQHFRVCLLSGYVDFVVRGHGEEPFRALLDALAAAAPPPGIRGVVAATSRGELPAEVAAVPDPEQLPAFPYHRLEVERYIRKTFLGRRTLSHHASYGCPFRCGFCAVVNLVDGKWRAQSAIRCAQVAEQLVTSWRIDGLELFDNNFFVSEARAVDFAGGIEKLGLGWWGEGRVDTLLRYRDESWRRLRRSGLKMVFMGAETASDAALARMNKGGTMTVEATLAIVRRMAEHGVVPELSFVLGAPPDPAEDVERTLRFIRRVKLANPLTEIILYLYTPVPLAGELLDLATAEGFAFPETLDAWVSAAGLSLVGRRSEDLPWLPRRAFRRARDFERVLNAYYPTVTNQRLNGVRRLLLRALGGWRYHLRVYGYPYELRAAQRLVAYQRPETAGF